MRVLPTPKKQENSEEALQKSSEASSQEDTDMGEETAEAVANIGTAEETEETPAENTEPRAAANTETAAITESAARAEEAAVDERKLRECGEVNTQLRDSISDDEAEIVRLKVRVLNSKRSMRKVGQTIRHILLRKEQRENPAQVSRGLP
ncbi:MAG: uncharacterized protein A8A55_3008 [Amphiamblys sp. WSBS2006]|nr:MAG: uncharacterized protein A8A55_3008 [Amphiamblys sp. WSBS2006]